MNNSLKELYYKRKNIINNKYINYKDFKKDLDFIEFKLLQHSKGYELLINLKIINNNRNKLVINGLTKDEKIYLFLKLTESVEICENILKLKENSLLSDEEIFIKNWLKFKLVLIEFKEKLLFCGCKM